MSVDTAESNVTNYHIVSHAEIPLRSSGSLEPVDGKPPGVIFYDPNLDRDTEALFPEPDKNKIVHNHPYG